jgi:hypothetical protein
MHRRTCDQSAQISIYFPIEHMMILIRDVLQVSEVFCPIVEVFLRNVQRNSITVEAFIELLKSESRESYKTA